MVYILGDLFHSNPVVVRPPTVLAQLGRRLRPTHHGRNVPVPASVSTPNLLTINREDGLGRLYYNAVLNVNRPVQDVRPLDQGMRIDRVFCSTASRLKGCSPLTSVQLASDQPVTAQLTLVLPHDSYYVMVEDFIPAGMEILDRSLLTSQQAIDPTDVEVQFDEKDPFAKGWGWWLFHEPQIRDDSILFSADSLPAGTYVFRRERISPPHGQERNPVASRAIRRTSARYSSRRALMCFPHACSSRSATTFRSRAARLAISASSCHVRGDSSLLVLSHHSRARVSAQSGITLLS